MKLNFYTYKTDIGSLNITADNFYIRYLSIGKYKYSNHIYNETELINNAFLQINEYLAGIRKQFELNIFYEGSIFLFFLWE